MELTDKELEVCKEIIGAWTPDNPNAPIDILNAFRKLKGRESIENVIIALDIKPRDNRPTLADGRWL